MPATAEALPLESLSDSADTISLIGEAKSGNHDAFDLLIRRYQRRVLKVAYQHVGNFDDAQDVAQEVFIRLYKYLGRIRDESKFETWLYRLAVNASYDLLGRRYSRKEVAPIEDREGRLVEVVDEESIPIDRAAEATELRERIVASLDRLTPSERTVFVLRDLDGLDVKEIAAIQEISPITVRRHLSSARQKMRAVLAALHPSFAKGDK